MALFSSSTWMKQIPASNEDCVFQHFALLQLQQFSPNSFYPSQDRTKTCVFRSIPTAMSLFFVKPAWKLVSYTALNAINHCVPSLMGSWNHWADLNLQYLAVLAHLDVFVPAWVLLFVIPARRPSLLLLFKTFRCSLSLMTIERLFGTFVPRHALFTVTTVTVSTAALNIRLHIFFYGFKFSFFSPESVNIAKPETSLSS